MRHELFDLESNGNGCFQFCVAKFLFAAPNVIYNVIHNHHVSLLLRNISCGWCRWRGERKIFCGFTFAICCKLYQPNMKSPLMASLLRRNNECRYRCFKHTRSTYFWYIPAAVLRGRKSPVNHRKHSTYELSN